jgi:hypothetical protein
MKKFIKRIFVFTLLLIVFFIAKKFFTPYYIGDRTIYAKYTDISEQDEKFNTFIFGSSRLYRHINSHLLDSLMSNGNYSTYNYAAPGTFNPAAYYLFENFINSSESNTVDRVFIELQSLSHYSENNCTTTKASYWNNSKYLLFSLNYIYNSQYSRDKKKELYSCYFKSYLFGFYDFSLFLNLFRPINMNEVGDNGYLSLENAMYLMRENSELKERWNDFHSDTTELHDRIEAAKVAAASISNNEVNRYHLDYLNSLIEEAESKGIQLIFILPPRLEESQYDELIPLAHALPQNYVIQMFNYSEFSEFYRADYSFDIGHLNTKGANLFTKFLAEEIKKLTNSENQD